MLKEKIRNARGYTQMVYLMREAGVHKDTVGYEALQIAVMAYLHDPTLTMEKLLKIATNESFMSVQDTKECFEAMKEVLQNINIRHTKELEKNDIVFQFIQRITAEIRIRKMIEITIIDEDLNVEEEVKELFCQLVVRSVIKPKHEFSKILNFVAGRGGYEDVEQMELELSPMIEKEELENLTEKFQSMDALIEHLEKELEARVSFFMKGYTDIKF